MTDWGGLGRPFSWEVAKCRRHSLISGSDKYCSGMEKMLLVKGVNRFNPDAKSGLRMNQLI